MPHTEHDGDPLLYFAEDGTPHSSRFGDIYYSPQDGLAESRAVFIEGCHLPSRWQTGGSFTILELGFGTGLNVAAAMALWVASGCPGHLHIYTIEAFVMTGDEAAQALANWPELADFAQGLMAQWPRKRRGCHYMDFPQWCVSVTIALKDVQAALDDWDGQADAIFLDGFSPALNPDMWTPDILTAVAAHARPGARLASFTVAGHVRRSLQAAGFTVEKRPGFGRKRERLEAWMAEGLKSTPPPGRIAVIGAGIAGLCLAWQARSQGLEVDVFDPAPGSGASGNTAALVTPRLDAGDNAISALFADAFYYATDLYRRHCPQAILGQGVAQAAMTEREAVRQLRIAGQAGFVSGDLAFFHAGEDPDLGQTDGLLQSRALYLSPPAVHESLMAGQSVIRQMVRPEDFGDYGAVILACGDGIFDMIELPDRFGLRPVRGQVEMAAVASGLHKAISWGGYAIPVAGGLLYGATHDRDDRGCDVRASSSDHNLANLLSALPHLARPVSEASSQSRASIRVTTRDYLPVVGQVSQGLYVMTGLGARGFCLAPLLAKALVSEVVGHGPTLARAQTTLLNPYRRVPKMV